MSDYPKRKIKKLLGRIDDRLNKNDEIKESCDLCKEKKESTYSNNLEKYMCDDCWDSYGEACHYGEA